MVDTKQDKKKSAPCSADLLDTNKDIDSKKYRFSLIKDMRSDNTMYHFCKFFLEDSERISDADFAFFDDDRTPSGFLIEGHHGTFTEVIIHAFAGSAIACDF